jgi:hypothetical protein
MLKISVSEALIKASRAGLQAPFSQTVSQFRSEAEKRSMTGVSG